MFVNRYSCIVRSISIDGCWLVNFKMFLFLFSCVDRAWRGEWWKWWIRRTVNRINGVYSPRLLTFSFNALCVCAQASTRNWRHPNSWENLMYAVCVIPNHIESLFCAKIAVFAAVFTRKRESSCRHRLLNRELKRLWKELPASKDRMMHSKRFRFNAIHSLVAAERELKKTPKRDHSHRDRPKKYCFHNEC